MAIMGKTIPFKRFEHGPRCQRSVLGDPDYAPLHIRDRTQVPLVRRRGRTVRYRVQKRTCVLEASGPPPLGFEAHASWRRVLSCKSG